MNSTFACISFLLGSMHCALHGHQPNEVALEKRSGTFVQIIKCMYREKLDKLRTENKITEQQYTQETEEVRLMLIEGLNDRFDQINQRLAN